MATLQDAREVTKVIVETLQPVLVLLFGSVAKDGKGDDLDFLIIVDDTQNGVQDCHLLIQKRLKAFYKRFAIDPFIIPESLFLEHYSKGSPFLNLIFQEGRYIYMKDAVKEWVSLAEEELNMALYLLDGKYFKGTCYHSQQCIEKAIKSFLLHKGWELEKTHSIERLVSIAGDYKIKISISDEDLVFMDSIYRGRYPVESGLLPFGDPSEEKARRAVQIAEGIFGEMRDKILGRTL